jgi:PAS domain S-box-containing protein
MTFSTKELSILVVEDNTGDFILVKDYLSEEIERPQIQHAKSFSQAKEILMGGAKFDSILLDLSLPDASGEQLVTDIMRMAGSTPVIVLTGYSGKDFGIKTLSLGISDYLFKDELEASQLYKSISYGIERKRIALQLKESEEKYRNLFQLCPMPMWVYDVETLRFLNVNTAAINHYGYDREEFLSMTIADIRPAEDLPIMNIALEALKKNANNPTYHFRHRKKDGSIIYIEIQSNEITFDGHRARLILATDITARLDAEQKLRNSEVALRQLNTELEERVAMRTLELVDVNHQLEAFSYSVSHDLRSPLRSIHGFTQILEKRIKDTLDQSNKELLDMIQSNTIKMEKLIENLLQFSKVGKQNAEKQLVDVKGLIENVWEQLTTTDYVNNKASLSINELPVCLADKPMLNQVFINLLSNALKYSSKKDNAEIEIGATENEHETVYYVKDNGAGFDMKYYDNLFAVFQRLHSPSEYDGTGVGLALVKRVIDKHGGHIWAEGTPGEGATFYFALPKNVVSEEYSG